MFKLVACLLSAVSLASAAAAPRKPQLVVTIVVDQFRYDYLTRFRSDYQAGLARLLTQGAVFTNARYEHYPTVTAVGHATVLTGATPSLSGVVNNEWYDRETGKNITSVSDERTQLLGAKKGAGSSPRRLLVSTLGDELKAVSPKSKVIGVSLKDRAAILPAGHSADGAYWFDNASGGFVSSTFYFDRLPGWVESFNQARPADRYCGARWLDRAMPADPTKLYPELAASPFGNELLEAFAERAVEVEQLGRRGALDLLTVSFSSNDYVGHRSGPDSPEVRDMCLRTDRLLGKFFAFLETHVGMRNVLVVMTADHGVSPTPEANQARRMPGGRIAAGAVTDAIEKALSARFGPARWIASRSESSIYFDPATIARKNLDLAEVNRVASAAAFATPHVFRVYTREQLVSGCALEDPVARRVGNGFHYRNGPDLTVLFDPYWIAAKTGTSHSTIFSYDAHAPILFMGPGVRPGRYHQTVAINDIAPTLATLLDLETPSGSVGRALAEIIVEPRP
jgi:hypothetical protein